MRIEPLLFMGVFSVAACARGSELRQPVGESTVTALPPHGEAAEVPGNAAGTGEIVPTADGSETCEMDALPMIEFFSESSRLGDPQAVTLRRVAGCLTAAPDDTNVVLVGYTNVVGTAAANLALGLERAQTVMKMLIDNGVAPKRIVVASAGELQRPKARWGMRADRVEILVTRGGPSRPNEAPVARGIDAEGLMPRPAPATVSTGSPVRTSPTPPRPVTTPTPARTATPAPRTR